MAASAPELKRFRRFRERTWALLSALAVVFLCGPARSERYAVLIASGTFPNTSPFRHYQLDAPANDVRLMASLLENRFGFPAAHIRLIGVPDGWVGPGARSAGRYATAAAIRSVLMQLSAQCRPGDDAVVYYSGHGAQVPDPDADTLTSDVLVPYDADASLTVCVSHAWIHRWRASVRPGVRLTLITDACYSQGVYTLPPDPAGTSQLPPPAIDPREFAEDVADERSKAIPASAVQLRSAGADRGPALRIVPRTLPPAAVLSACAGDEETYEETLHGRDGRGPFAVSLFTWVLYRTLSWAPTDMTNAQLARRIAEQLKALGKSAHPQLDGSAEVLRRPAIGRATEPSPAFRVDERPQSGLVLQAGYLAGLHRGMIFESAAPARHGLRIAVVRPDWLISSAALVGGVPPAPRIVVFAAAHHTLPQRGHLPRSH